MYACCGERLSNIFYKHTNIDSSKLNLKLLTALPATHLFSLTEACVTCAVPVHREAGKTCAVFSRQQPINDRFLKFRRHI